MHSKDAEQRRADAARSSNNDASLGLTPWQPDGRELPVGGEFRVMVSGGRYMLCSPLRDREPVPVSSDFVFALGSVLGFFEPFDAGRDIDGARLVHTRAALLRESFGPGWERYARAVARCDARRGAPLAVVGLPR